MFKPNGNNLPLSWYDNHGFHIHNDIIVCEKQNLVVCYNTDCCLVSRKKWVERNDFCVNCGFTVGFFNQFNTLFRHEIDTRKYVATHSHFTELQQRDLIKGRNIVSKRQFRKFENDSIVKI
jgi:hypothetical protein